MTTPRTGYVEPGKRADGTPYYRARVWLRDDSRERVDIPEKHAYSAERRALYAAAMQEREDETGELYAKKLARIAARSKPVDPTAGETCTKYRERLDEHRRELGIGSAKDDASAWRAWIGPTLGDRPIATVTREEIETFRDLLDGEIAKHTRTEGREGLSPKRALNVWSVLTTTFKAPLSAKRRDLRVRTDNPCAGVLPPEKGDPRRKTFVYPNELAAVLGSLDVGLEWREAYAVGAYLYLRPGEFHALTWGDVDLAASVVHVTKAWNARTKALEAPKTRNGHRDVPIAPTLVPLLVRMRRRPDGTERDAAELVCPIVAGTPESKRAPKFVAALRAAGIERPRLFESTATTMAVNFRSLRDSGITWLALAGVDSTRMLRRAGHDHVSTTLEYVKQAEDLGGGMGEPFGPLPATLLDGTTGKGDEPPKSMGRRPRYQPKLQPKSPAQNANRPDLQAQIVEAAGVETAQFAEFTAFPEIARPVSAPSDSVSARSQVAAGPSSEHLGQPSASPRATLLAALGRAIGDATAAGDLEAARVAHRALGELLASAATEPAGVVSLDRHRRGGAL